MRERNGERECRCNRWAKGQERNKDIINKAHLVECKIHVMILLCFNTINSVSVLLQVVTKVSSDPHRKFPPVLNVDCFQG